MKAITLTLSLLLVLGAPVMLSSQENLPGDETVWDRIGENDIQAVGYVTFVNEETFELRSPEKGTLTFPIPDQEGVMQHIASGKRVQVWYDPSLDTDGLSGRVSYVESFELAPEETEVENEVEQTISTIGNETEEAAEEVADEAQDAWNETESALEQTGDEIERETEQALNETEEAFEETGDEFEETANEFENETEEALNETESELDETRTFDTETDDFSFDNRSDFDGDELPQTASSVPANALAGLFLMGLGALVWGSFRRS